MDKGTIRTALAAVGKLLPARRPIEMLIVGGAAGLLSGELGGAYTTGDVDALLVLPPGEWDQLQDAAAEVGKAMSLPASWLNREAGLYAESLPSDWISRRVNVGCFGVLQVWAVGRLDLIAMKFYSHRPQDREHLLQMNVTQPELKFVLRYLDSLEQVAEKGKIEMARLIVENWA
ncbi:MAG: DUF6036 family nucleotidyltransferase [Tepidisphaeraceae bacterium]|jgi:hypothetical protein